MWWHFATNKTVTFVRRNSGDVFAEFCGCSTISRIARNDTEMLRRCCGDAAEILGGGQKIFGGAKRTQ
jgi:hypothetical protein